MLSHYIDVIMTTMASQITSLVVFYSIVYQAQIKENIKAPRHWPLSGEFTGTGEFPAQRASNAENVSIWWRHHVSRTLEATCYTICWIIQMHPCLNQAFRYQIRVLVHCKIPSLHRSIRGTGKINLVPFYAQRLTKTEWISNYIP